MPHVTGIWELIPHALPWINLAIAIYAVCHTVHRSGKNAKWEEYRETVYEPIMEELRCIDRAVKLCRRIEEVPDEESAKDFLDELPLTLNDLEIACDKASSHGSTFSDNWSAFADGQCNGVLEFIGSNALSARIIPQGLSENLQDFSREFHKRLREQRMRMTGSWSPWRIFKR